jgi:hypothetical protein
MKVMQKTPPVRRHVRRLLLAALVCLGLGAFASAASGAAPPPAEVGKVPTAGAQTRPPAQLIQKAKKREAHRPQRNRGPGHRLHAVRINDPASSHGRSARASASSGYVARHLFGNVTCEPGVSGMDMFMMDRPDALRANMPSAYAWTGTPAFVAARVDVFRWTNGAWRPYDSSGWVYTHALNDSTADWWRYYSNGNPAAQQIDENLPHGYYKVANNIWWAIGGRWVGNTYEWVPHFLYTLSQGSQSTSYCDLVNYQVH